MIATPPGLVNAALTLFLLQPRYTTLDGAQMLSAKINGDEITFTAELK